MPACRLAPEGESWGFLQGDSNLMSADGPRGHKGVAMYVRRTYYQVVGSHLRVKEAMAAFGYVGGMATYDLQ